MFSIRSLLAAAPLLAFAAASSIAFTHTPAEAVAGQSYNITWGGGDNTGVTLTLRQGNPQDLNTIETIADNIQTDYYVWTVPSTLESADDYALQIVQGLTDINYSGLFTISGGSASSATSSASSTAMPTGYGNSTVTSMASASGTGTAMSRNSTFSTATLSASSSGTYSFNAMTTSTSSGSSATRMPSSATTSAPSNNAPVRTGSSAALILGIVAAVMLH